MNMKEWLNTLDSTKTVRRFREEDKPILKVVYEQEIDWNQRSTTKNKLFINFLLSIFIGLICSISFIGLPLFLTNFDTGRMFLLSITPMLFVSITWGIGAWWAYDKARSIFMVLTLGMMPIRIIFVLGWINFMSNTVSLNTQTFLLFMMFHWIIFMIPEIYMLVSFTKQLEMTSHIEP